LVGLADGTSCPPETRGHLKKKMLFKQIIKLRLKIDTERIRDAAADL